MKLADLFRPRLPVGALVALVLPLAVLAGSTAALAVVAVRLYKPGRAYLKSGAKASAAGLQTKIDLDAVAAEVEREMAAGMGLGPPGSQEEMVRQARAAPTAQAPAIPPAPRAPSIRTREEDEAPTNHKPAASADGLDA